VTHNLDCLGITTRKSPRCNRSPRCTIRKPPRCNRSPRCYKSMTRKNATVKRYRNCHGATIRKSSIFRLTFGRISSVGAQNIDLRPKLRNTVYNGLQQDLNPELPTMPQRSQEHSRERSPPKNRPVLKSPDKKYPPCKSKSFLIYLCVTRQQADRCAAFSICALQLL
jgi:hypothetical protein